MLLNLVSPNFSCTNSKNEGPICGSGSFTFPVDLGSGEDNTCIWPNAEQITSSVNYRVGYLVINAPVSVHCANLQNLEALKKRTKVMTTYNVSVSDYWIKKGHFVMNSEWNEFFSEPNSFHEKWSAKFNNLSFEVSVPWSKHSRCTGKRVRLRKSEK